MILLTNGLALWVCDKVDISVGVRWDIAKGAGISLTHCELVTTVIQVCLLLWHCHWLMCSDRYTGLSNL